MKINYIEAARKTVKIEITSCGCVNVYYPKGASLKFVQEFVQKKRRWIEGKLSEIQGKRAKNASIFDLKSLLLLGKEVKLIFDDVKKPVLTDTVLILPEDCQNNQDLLKRQLRSFIMKFGKDLLPQCISYFSEIVGKCPSRVAISQPKSIWGSCNAKKEIRLNAKLVMLPKNLMEYVVVHELCHLIELNHSKNFWAYVSNFCDVKKCRAELKQYNYLIELF